MYYSTELFIKKGAMGKIWLFGTLGIERAKRKFKAREVLDASISECCEQVQSPPIPLAFATQSILMYGTVAIYHYQMTVELKEAHHAYRKLMRLMAIERIKRTNIDLPPQQLHADAADITLQERPLDVQHIEMHDLHLTEASTIIEQLPARIQRAEDLIAPEAAITMRATEKPVAALDRTLIDLGLTDVDIEEVAIELDLDLDEHVEAEELRELSIESRSAVAVHADIDGQLPEPSALIELRDLSASAEPLHHIEIPEQPSSILPVSPPPMPMQRVSVGRRSVPPSEATPSPRAPPSLSVIAALPQLPAIAAPEHKEEKEEEVKKEREEREEKKEGEEATQQRRPRRTRRRTRRFERDAVIELPEDERLIDWENTQQIQQMTVDRPQFTHIDERALGAGEFEQLFTTSLTGLYRENAMEDAFREFANMILSPRLQQERLQRDAEQVADFMHAPQEVPSLVDHEAVAAEPELAEVPAVEMSVPEIAYAHAGPPSVVGSIPSSLPSSDMFAGYKIPSSIHSIAPPIQIAKKPSPQRLEIGDITVSEEEEEEFMEERKRRREEKRRARVKAKATSTSSEELSVPPNVSRLTTLFKGILDEEMTKLEQEALDHDYEMKVNLEQMLRFHANQNEALLSKRDMALGFMQVLILKNENIIHVQQDRFHDDIYLMKGPAFHRQLPP